MHVRGFALGILAVVGVAIAGGILLIGGPDEARRTRFDQQRYQELAFIGEALLCKNWRVANPVLPEQLTVETLRSYCGGVQVTDRELTDNETGQPYAYRRESNEEFSVCATFSDAERLMQLRPRPLSSLFSFDPGTGCISGRIG